MKRTTQEQLTREMCQWLEAGGHDTAGLTGTDTRTLMAVSALWEVWANTQSHRVQVAVAELVLDPRLLQAKFRPLAVELVAKAANWSDREKVAAWISNHVMSAPYASDSGETFDTIYETLTIGLAIRQ